MTDLADLNWRIAQAKGWTIGGKGTTHYYLDPDGNPADPPSLLDCNMYAWRLMREMAGTGACVFPGVGDWWCCEIVAGEATGTYYGDTPEEAIGEAWLAWKAAKEA